MATKTERIGIDKDMFASLHAADTRATDGSSHIEDDEDDFPDDEEE